MKYEINPTGNRTSSRVMNIPWKSKFQSGGEYTLEIELPAGWCIYSGNRTSCRVVNILWKSNFQSGGEYTLEIELPVGW